MKKYTLLLLILLILSSCELATSDKTTKRTVYLVSVGLDYENTNISNLEGTLNDQNAIISEFGYLSKEENSAFLSCKLTQNSTGCTYIEESYPRIGDTYRYKEKILGGMKKKLLSVLEMVAERAEKNDLVIFYYAGHGVGVKKEETDIQYLNGALVLGDLEFPDIGDWRKLPQNQSELMDITELRKQLSNIEGQVVIIMDSCYSGTVVRDDTTLAPLNNIGKAFSLIFTSGETTKRRIWEIAAAREDEKSYESSENGMLCHGKFTYSILKAMGYNFSDGSYESPGRPENGKISLANLYSAAKSSLEDETQNPDHSQTIRDLILFNLR